MSLPKKIHSLVIRLWLFLRKLESRVPRRFRVFGGPLLGGLIGLIGGVPGFLIGLLLGYLLGELFTRSRRNKKITGYFRNPGPQQFYEGEPGLAAFCALGILVVSADNQKLANNGFGRDSENGSSSPSLFAEKNIRQVVLGASLTFTGPGADPSLMEHFARIAWANRDALNSDLLAESFLARRALSGGGENYGRFLYGLAGGEQGKALAREIRLILEPGRDEPNPGCAVHKDPWKILGLPPGTPPDELKAHYRRLAKFFHPDELQILDEKHRETSAQAFIAIKEAYKEVLEKN